MNGLRSTIPEAMIVRASSLLMMISFFVTLISVMGCAVMGSVAPRTLASNAYEEELQRVVLPGVAQFEGRTANPVCLFAWLEKESIEYDSVKDKVHFTVRISSNDIPSRLDTSQTNFVYRSSNLSDRIMLPDAVKYYAGIFGFGFEFKKNEIYVYSHAE
jgi:hypothetical protein